MTSFQVTCEPCSAFRFLAYKFVTKEECDAEAFRRHLDGGCEECIAYVKDYYYPSTKGADTIDGGEFPWKTVLAILACAIFGLVLLLG